MEAHTKLIPFQSEMEKLFIQKLKKTQLCKKFIDVKSNKNFLIKKNILFWYYKPVTIQIIVNFVAATLIDHISVNNKSKIHIAGIILSYIFHHFPTFYIDQTKIPKPKLQPYKLQKMNQETQDNFLKLLQSAFF